MYFKLNLIKSYDKKNKFKQYVNKWEASEWNRNFSKKYKI